MVQNFKVLMPNKDMGQQKCLHITGDITCLEEVTVSILHDLTIHLVEFTPENFPEKLLHMCTRRCKQECSGKDRELQTGNDQMSTNRRMDQQIIQYFHTMEQCIVMEVKNRQIHETTYNGKISIQWKNHRNLILTCKK